MAVLAESLLSYPRGSLQASQFVCLVSKNITVLPKVFFSVSDCTEHVTQTIPLVYPERVAGGMAVCAKTIYHDVDVGQMVEWFELQRLQGVNRIQAFHFQLRGEQKQVLEYYSMLGYLLLQPLVLPVGLGGEWLRHHILIYCISMGKSWASKYWVRYSEPVSTQTGILKVTTPSSL